MAPILGLGLGVQKLENEIGGSGGGVPVLPTDQLVAHYKSDAGINLTGSGITATVNQWDNQISANHNLSQANGVTWEPTYVPVSTVFGGKPMLYANSDGLFPATTSDDFTLSDPGVFTYAFVFKTDGAERYLWDARGQGTGQSRQAGYYENGIERTTAGGWVGVGPQWFNAGYGGMQQGIKPYASGTNSNMAPQSFNNASYPNLWSAGLEIWVCVYKGGYTYWSCNGRILGNSAFMPTSPAVPYFQRMENNWSKADKLSPTVFGGYYGPQKGYGQGAMAEFLVYDKALTIEEHNDLVDNLADKYKINYIKSTNIEGIPLDADFGDFKQGTTQITIAAPNDVYLNTNNYTNFFAMDVKKGVDFKRPGKYEFKFGENPAGGANPIFYPGFTFMSPVNAMMQNTAWTANNFPDLSTLKPSTYVYWSYAADQGQAPGIYIRKNADTTYSYTIGSGFSPVYYRLKDWTVFTSAGATPPFTVRIEWPGGATYLGMKWYIDDVLVWEVTQTEFETLASAVGAAPTNKMTWLPSPGFPYVYGRIGRVYDMKLLEGHYIKAPWDYESCQITQDGLIGHWDAGSGVTLNGADVAGWADKVNGHVLAQSTPAKQPLFVASGALNNQPAIEFSSASAQVLESATNYVGNTTGDFTVLTVFRPVHVGGTVTMSPVMWADNSRAQGYYMLKSGGVDQTYSMQQSNPVSGTISSGYVNNTANYYTTGGVHCIMGSTGEAKRFYIRGNNREMIDANGSGTYSTNTTTGFGIGAGRNSTIPFDGQIMEIIVYNRLLSLAELMEAEKNLMFKYQIFG